MRKHLVQRLHALAQFHIANADKDAALSCYDMMAQVEQASDAEVQVLAPRLLGIIQGTVDTMPCAGEA